MKYYNAAGDAFESWRVVCKPHTSVVGQKDDIRRLNASYISAENELSAYTIVVSFVRNS